MIQFESDNGFRKIAMWHNEIPFHYVSNQVLNIKVEAGKCIWHEGIICIEVKLNPRHASNYAMICVRYARTKLDGANIIIHYGNDSKDNTSDDFFNKNAIIGFNDYFAEAIYEFFQECPGNIIPNGIIEVIGGAYDEVGSSNISFKCAMKLLTWIFLNYEKNEEKSFGDELLSKIYEYQ